MKPKYFLISLLSIFVLLSSCYQDPYYHTQVFLVNNSSDTIFCNYKTMKNNSDTLLPDNSKHNKKIPPSKRVAYSYFCAEQRFGYVEKKHAMITVFDYEVIRNNSWDTIKKYDLVEKRYLLDIDLLEQNDYVLTYP